jgi:hypothetical protein
LDNSKKRKEENKINKAPNLKDEIKSDNNESMNVDNIIKNKLKNKKNKN